MRYIHKLAAQLLNKSYNIYNYKNCESDVQVYVTDVEGTRHINIPGTKSKRNWRTNFNITPYRHEGYKGDVQIHEGYYRAYLSVQGHILTVCKTNLKLQINGHSSGGAIAQIAAVDINYRFGKKIEVVTFGTPKIGNKAWKRSAERRIANTNYLNIFDPIPLFLPFNHRVGTNILNLNLYWNPHSIKNYGLSNN